MAVIYTTGNITAWTIPSIGTATTTIPFNDSAPVAANLYVENLNATGTSTDYYITPTYKIINNYVTITGDSDISTEYVDYSNLFQTVPYDLNTSDWLKYSYKYSSDNYYSPSPEEMKKINIQSRLRNNWQIFVESRADWSGKISGPEQKAVETLREMVTEEEYRKYIKYGFVLVRGQSGKTYQVFKNKSHCRVWLGGKIVEEICVRIKDRTMPATDNVVAFKAMIECDEELFRSSGNVYKLAAAA